MEIFFACGSLSCNGFKEDSSSFGVEHIRNDEMNANEAE
jgi:hypothetical protein